MAIKSIQARAIFDSRGYPTVEADVVLSDGTLGRASVPSGASTGSKEALELRDGKVPFDGKGVRQAIKNVNEVIAPAINGHELTQTGLDSLLNELDGTENKSKLGANATLAVSLAFAKAKSTGMHLPLFRYVAGLLGSTELSLPMPMFNVLNGGAHAQGSTDIQEFMIVPVGAKDFPEALRAGSEVFHSLGHVLAKRGYATTVGDEGGYAPAIKRGTDEAIKLIEEAVESVGVRWGEDISLALDVAANELVTDKGYEFKREKRKFKTDKLIDEYKNIASIHPLISLEDGLSEEDWEGWQKLTRELGSTVQLVGDDLLVTNTKLLAQAIEQKAGNAILIKPNQIGTLTETVEAIKMAKSAGWRTIMSHRSGETEDTTIAHLAVGLNCGQIKAGSMSRSERLAKYNELLRISELVPGIQLAKPFN